MKQVIVFFIIMMTSTAFTKDSNIELLIKARGLLAQDRLKELKKKSLTKSEECEKKVELSFERILSKNEGEDKAVRVLNTDEPSVNFAFTFPTLNSLTYLTMPKGEELDSFNSIVTFSFSKKTGHLKQIIPMKLGKKHLFVVNRDNSISIFDGKCRISFSFAKPLNPEIKAY